MMPWRVSSYISQGGEWARKGGRRGRVVVVLAVLVAVWMTATVLRPIALHLFFPTDNCTALTQEKPQLPWQPNQEQWWHKLCRLEHTMRQISYDCGDKRWMGNRRVCFDFNLVPPDSCIVYSFGIAYDFRFDDAMAEYGCTVFSFDPSMNVSDHQHADRVYFKRLGVAGKDTDSFAPRLDSYVHGSPLWHMRRLSSIMKDLGHAQGSVTVVKMDIESYEWEVMEDLLSEAELLASIPQLLIEWHLFADAPPRTRYDDLLSIYSHYRARGFHTFHWNNEGMDHNIDTMRTQTETSWVNERFLTASKS